MLSRTAVAIAVAALGVLASACGSGRNISTSDSRVIAECIECHGGGDNGTGAPPRDVSGRSDPSLASVGAHTAHVQLADDSLANAYDCDACHPKPAAVRSAKHLDGTVQITFGALATAGGMTSPGYDRTTHGCASTYCHGSFTGGNPGNVPVWTAGAAAAACGTCHGDPAATATALPRGIHPALAPTATNATCHVCHPDTVKADGTVDVAKGKHVNGVNGDVDVDPAAVHPAGWTEMQSPNFHGLVAGRPPLGPDPCFRCHVWQGTPTVSAIVCWNCHRWVR
jgi:predicted CxxxxCH...CXXCH cytochrome family protein